MYLLDTNIFIEFLLDQDQADNVERFFKTIPLDRVYISDFSVFSIGIILFHRKLFESFVKFYDDLIIYGGVSVLKMPEQELTNVVKFARENNLDFDDAYQYAIAEKFNLEIVSFDKDFDITARGRNTPSQIVDR